MCDRLAHPNVFSFPSPLGLSAFLNLDSLLDLPTNHYYQPLVSSDSLFSSEEHEDVPIVLQKQEYDKLLKCKYKDLNLKIKKDNPKCPIQLEKFKDDDSVIVLSCNHLFTEESIEQWLLKTSYKCPVCRNTVGVSIAILDD